MGKKTVRFFPPALLVVFMILVFCPAQSSGAVAAPPSYPGVPSLSELAALSVVTRVEDEREDLTRIINDLELRYGMVKNQSIQLELERISRSLTPFLFHPEFPVQIVMIDYPKPACFYLGGETVVLTRGLIFSHLLKNTDAVAGLVALLLSRHDLLQDLPWSGRLALHDLVQRRDRAAKNAAILLVRAGYHYDGAVEAARILDGLRKGSDWTKTISWLITEKSHILSEEAELEDGVSILLAGRPASSVPFLVRFVTTNDLSIEGRFWLGLAYYRDFFGSLSPTRQTIFFSVDPIPRLPDHASPHLSFVWELRFAQAIWSGILRDNPAFSPAWNGLGRIAMMQGKLRMAVRFFGHAARLNPESPWYEADFALALWMRDHKVLGLHHWNSATSQAGYDPRLIYDQSVLSRMGENLLPVGFSSIKDLPGWEFVKVLWGESVGEKRIRSLPAFIGKFLTSPLLPGMPVSKVLHLVGLPTTTPVRSHRYLIWDYRYRNYRLSLRGGVLRISEFYGKNRKVLPEYPPRPLSTSGKNSSENDPVEVIPYARIAYLRYQTIHHIWVVQRVGTVLDRFIILTDRWDHPGSLRGEPGGPMGYTPPTTLKKLSR
jgi:tetratricopeptide (TPR) repeat protein